MAVETKTQVKMIARLPVMFVSEVINGEILDTQVKIGGHTLVWIQGDHIEEFAKEISEAINAYSIGER